MSRSRRDNVVYDWPIVDPAFKDPATAAVAQRLMDLVRSNWTADVQFDLDEAGTRAMLDTHRVSTLIPTRCIVEHQRDEFRQRLATINGVQLRIESAARDVVSLLGAEGIDHRLLKGMASAHLDYPSPTLRQTGDVDIAVPNDRLADCVNLLKQDGCRELLVGKPDHRTKGIPLAAKNGTEVDIHTRLFKRSPVNGELFACPGVAQTAFGGFALAAEERLVHAGGHFILTPAGMRRMSGLIDITVMRNTTEIDLERALRFAKALGVAGPVGAALRLEAQLTARDPSEVDLGSWPQPDWLDRATLLTPSRRLVLEHFSRFRDVPRGRRLSYLPHWLTPDDHQRRVFRRALDGKRQQRVNKRAKKNLS